MLLVLYYSIILSSGVPRYYGSTFTSISYAEGIVESKESILGPNYMTKLEAFERRS